MIRVILRDTVRDLGKRGEVVEVSDGFARNHLFPKGLAMRSSAGAEDQAAAMRTARSVKDARDRSAAEEIAKRLAPTIVRLAARASGEGGRLFGSITEGEIVEAIYQQTGFEIDRRRIDLEDHIKTTGMHLVPIHLHSDVQIFLQLEVGAQ